MKSDLRSFVTTIPLRTTPQDESVLRKRFKAAQSFYNAMLGECLRRSRLMRQARAWRAARKMPRGKEKTQAYRALNKQFGFREYDLYPRHPVGGTCIVEQRQCWIGDHLDAHTCQALAARAFAAVERSIFDGGKVRFRRLSDMRSVEGTGRKSPLHWDSPAGAVIWSGLSLPAVIDAEDPVVMHGLRSRVRYTRIVRMTIRGRQRYFAQLVCEGNAYTKPRHAPVSGIVGLDVGPSTIAIVSARAATLETFCTELNNRQEEIRRLQRQADRQVRAANPDCFDERGRWIKGRRASIRSIRLNRTREQIAELARREASHRKNLHGQLVARVLSRGNDIRTESISYKGFQRQFGRSVKFRAPGGFIARLRTEAAKHGATVTEFGTRKTMLSQTCPKCFTLIRKPLSERQHICSCGAVIQRDLSSAHLARFVQDGKLDTSRARKAWKGLCNVLRAVSGKANGSTSGAKARALPHKSAGRGPSHAKAISSAVSGPDVVAGRKMQARARQKPWDDGTNALSVNVKRAEGKTYEAQRDAGGAGRGSRRMSIAASEQMVLWPKGERS